MVRDQRVKVNASTSEEAPNPIPLTPAQHRWLACGLEQAGGKLPLFDRNGRRVNTTMVRRCIEKGLAEPWFANPIKPDWLVCKLTPLGRASLAAAGTPPEKAPDGFYDT